MASIARFMFVLVSRIQPISPHFIGVALAMSKCSTYMAVETPQKWGEMGWILETNRNMNRAMEAMGGRVVRRFRVYERDL